MTGYVDYEDVPEVYRRAGIFVSPTYAEGFSNTILEAMASRMAVVSCRSVGVVDCIRDGENGLLTEPGDVPALAEALRRVLRDRALRRASGGGGARGVPRACIPGRRSAAQIMDVYAQLSGQRAGPGLAARPADHCPAGSAPNRICCECRPRCSSRRIWTMSVFSCGGLLAQLGDRGWRTVLATAFTATVLPATGFALACQLDKGLGPEVDYMALRRDEDRAAAAILGVSDLRWLDLPEAPHRGYGSRAGAVRRRPGGRRHLAQPGRVA